MSGSKARAIIRTAVFLLAFCLIFFYVQELVTPNYNWPGNGTRQGNNIRDLYREPNDSLQVLWIGGSHMRCGLMPMAVYRKEGIRSYNLATDAQTMSLSLARLELVFERQSPQIVVLDVSSCFISQASDKLEAGWRKVIDSISWNRFRDKYHLMRALCALNDWGWSDLISGVFPVLRYHDNYLLTSSEYQNENREALSFTKGYSFLMTVSAATGLPDANDHITSNEKWLRILDYNRPILERMLALCKAHGCELILTKMPVNVSAEEYHSYWNRMKHDLIAGLADELDCRFLDLNYENIDIDWSRDTKDAGRHLNSRGARKVSDFFAQWLAENYDFAAVSADVSASWDRQLDLFDWEETLYSLKMETEFDTYMRQLSEGGYTVFAAATGTFGEAWSGAALETLADVVGAESEWREALRSPDGGAFVAAGSGGEKLRGNMDAKKCAAKGSLAGGEDYELSGKATKSGGASIRVGSQEYKCEGEGLLIVVYDDALGCVVDSVAFTEKKGAIKAGRDRNAGKMHFRKSLARYEEEALKGL